MQIPTAFSYMLVVPRLFLLFFPDLFIYLFILVLFFVFECACGGGFVSKILFFLITFVLSTLVKSVMIR